MRSPSSLLGAVRSSRSAATPRVASLVAVTLFAVAPLAGCKSKPEKICANLEAMVGQEAPDKPLSAEEKAKCAADIQRELDACENAETIAACYLDAKKLEDVGACESKCAKKRAAKPTPSASAAPE